MRRGRRGKQLVAASMAGCLAIGAAIFITSCEREGPAERLGKEVDRAVEDARDALCDPGPAERAGKNIDRAVEDAQDRAARAVDAEGR
ncbi:MAG TPA: hypothetical protein VNN62_02805 [Methylomirabilota bacterium]|nr:hypothetical protein [Methylomirabilota bacterium]